MSRWPGAGSFGRQLAVWSVRGALCATPGFRIALSEGYNSDGEKVAMVLGIGTYVVAFAWLSALLARQAVAPRSFLRALRWAANIRTAVAAVAVAFPSAIVSMAELWLDLVGGVFATGMARMLGQAFNVSVGPEADSLGWTYLTTVMHGALVAATIGLVTGLLWGGWAVWAARRN